MKKRFSLLVFLILNISANTIDLFSDEQAEGLRFLEKRKTKIEKVLEQYDGLNPSTVLASVAPELMRYHLFQNFIETKVLEKWYVEYGADQADFSIGYFQMKPSFIEKLEDHLKEISTSDCIGLNHFNYPIKTPSAIRKERLERLKDFQWQLHYACLFYIISEHCFGELAFKNKAERVQFYATAYNFGFEKSIEKIYSWESTKAFPYGKKFKFEQAAYGELATQFYFNLLSIFTSKSIS